jgi:glycosyltransferase involved in cell wall biosynthesis
MRIVLGITMRNEVMYGPHVEWQLDDALEMDYDDIVVLDDGSTDSTWEILKEYESKNKHLHVFRTEKNSVLDDAGKNRWMTLVGHMSTFNPTWINVRAADQIYSSFYKKNIRKVLKYFLEKKVHMVLYPLVHLWRSESWYRDDRVWGNDLRKHTKRQVWRYNPKYKYKDIQKNAVLHRGGHIPADMGFKEKIKHANVNNYFEDDSIDGVEKFFPIIVLHYGHTTHVKKDAKFRLSMQQAGSEHSLGMPGSSEMPLPSRWLAFNGYKGFYEFDMELKPAPALWFEEGYEVGPKPEPKSFYETILEYNKKAAEEYKILFDKAFKKEIKRVVPEQKSDEDLEGELK